MVVRRQKFCVFLPQRVDVTGSQLRRLFFQIDCLHAGCLTVQAKFTADRIRGIVAPHAILIAAFQSQLTDAAAERFAIQNIA